jgi:hypothetical protein
MYCKRIVVSCLAVSLLSVGICETRGQEGLPSPGHSYYQPRVATNYPLLTGNRIPASESIVGPTETVVGGIGRTGFGCGCGIPLIPALAQGLRDTLDCIFPCRGMNRGRGLFFSERFYGSNCYGCGPVLPGVIYETGPADGPTPAKSIEEVPAQPAPPISSVLPSSQGRFPANLPVGNGVGSGMVRPVNYSVPILPNASRLSTIPDNPLRR